MDNKLLLRVLLPLGILTTLWYTISLVYSSPLIPSPREVLLALIDLFYKHNLLSHLITTLLRVLAGFSLGIITGIAIGITTILSKIIRDTVYPVIAFIAVTPSFAFIPLLMIWIGLNDLLPITVVAICVGFPLAYAIVSGAKSVDRDILDVALTLGLHSWKLVRYIVLPLVLTHIASLLKLEAGHSWRLVFVTEYLALSSGLGYLMVQAYSLIRVDEIIALIILLGILALAIQYFIEYIESKITSKWGYRGLGKYGQY
ncbi:MAG: ABC transporter permease subunit [Thermoprotei archaeon]